MGKKEKVVLGWLVLGLVLGGCGTQKAAVKEVTEEEVVPPAETAVPSEPAASAIPAVEPSLVGLAAPLPFWVYEDRVSRNNHYCPSGWMGDYGDIKLNENYKINPHSGQSCIQLVYTVKRSQGAGWAGIYWQNPPNNWGTVKGGYNLTGASKLSFYARGEKGGEIAEFKMGGLRGEYSDSDAASTGPVSLTKGWKKYTLDLKGLDLSYLSGGFCWVATANDSPDGGTIYLDDILYEK